jgi:hypothetical protein
MSFKRIPNRERADPDRASYADQLVQWAERALHGLDESEVFVGVLDEQPLDQGRIEFTLQLGHALLTDKPIVLPVPIGVQIPEKLRAVADQIVYYDPANLDSLQAALAQALTELGFKKH